MTSKPGVPVARRLGPYEFIGPLAAGGMGEVHRARDTRLGREVAIKVLPPDVSADSDRLRRFEKEARAASSLNHPNIVTIYEVERIDSTSFIVMELVDGKTLRDLLSEGPLPVRRLLAIAAQVAEGLARAHSAGIVHRDLKPENVMVTKDGLVKILDFGLAKLAHPEQEGGELTQGPTVSGGTSPGVVMGTVGYMSPEQASGHPVDFRSDQFSFGAVLYEMATGKAPFRKPTAAQTLAAIIQDEPEPIATVNPAIPVPLRWILDRCLSKEPNGRYASTEDLAREVANVRDHLSQISSVEAALPQARRGVLRKRELLGWAIAAVLTLAGALLLSRRTATVPLNRIQASLLPPPGLEFDRAEVAPPAVSPDGRRVVFRAGDSLWLRSFSEKDARKLPGTENGAFPFWSPDSQSIGFITLWDFKLRRTRIDGVASQLIVEAPGFRGGTWNADDTILFGQSNGPLLRVSAGGGQATPVTRLDTSREIDHRFPCFLPDGRHFLYLVLTRPFDLQRMDLAAGSLGSKETRIIGKVTSNVAYSPPGFLLWNRIDRTLVAQPFDAARLRLSGTPFVIAEDVLTTATAPAANFSVSSNGVAVYVAGPWDYPLKLAWLDRSGRQLETFGPTGNGLAPALSPDGTRLASRAFDAESSVSRLWLYDIARGTNTRLTFDAEGDDYPIWSPDGSQVAFGRPRDGVTNIYVKSASGSGTETRLLTSPFVKVPMDWSPDGAFLLYAESNPKAWEEEKGELWALPMAGGKPVLVAHNIFGGSLAKFSPDGRYVAYTSAEGGRFALYVQDFPRPAQRWQISTDGGSQARWRRDGKELFYVSAKNTLMAVDVRTNPSFSSSTPRVLFPRKEHGTYMAGRRAKGQLPDVGFEVTGDGTRFLLVVPDPDVLPPPITVVFNWLAAKPLK